MVEKTECGVGVRSRITESCFIAIFYQTPFFTLHFMGREKDGERRGLATKSRQSLFNESNRIEIRFFLSLDIDRLDCKRFAARLLSDFIRLRLFHFMGHKHGRS